MPRIPSYRETAAAESLEFRVSDALMAVMDSSNNAIVLCAGLSPAWQHVMVFPSFRYGEVNRTSNVRWLAQGKAVNAGIAAHHLGGPSLTLSPIGGPAMTLMDRELAELGVARRWIVTKSPTRVCTTILDQATGTMTELIEDCQPLEPAELDEFRRAYAEEAAKAAVVVLTGSLPLGTSSTYYRELVEQTPCPVVLDFRGEGLVGILDLKPLVVKPNREELAQTIGRAIDDDRQLLGAMRSLNRRGAQWVVTTQGERPVWVTSASQTYCLHCRTVDKVVNPIGSGDAMAAGIAWAIRDGRSVVDAVALGMAAAVENLRRLETCRLDPNVVRRLAREVRIEAM
jgi:tagatose 6-phosphate kinase